MSAAAPPAPAPRHNLLPATAALFGREAELGRVRRALGSARLVTLIGPGGVGKTRLALAAAEGQLAGYPNGVWLVELAPLADPELVPTAVAAVLGVREEPGQELAETLAEHLGGKRLLLVLDNCEHLRQACAELVPTLLGAAPGLNVLATSRAPLGLGDERRLAVPPLALPAPGEVDAAAVAATPAVALFVARARTVEPSFALDVDNAPAVAAICARLDGLPLAIELAAARVKVRTPAALLADLTERLEVLVGGRRGLPARQRTVRGLLDWSFTLLSPGEQALFARLSVFAGGWTAEAAQAVCVIEDDLPMPVDEGLASLVEQSLVLPVRDGRYGMLETVREYAAYTLERLSAEGDAEATRRQHLDYFLALAEEAEPHLGGADQGRWLERLEAEHVNLRSALSWARERGAGEEGLRLAGALWRFWEARGYIGEGRGWLEAALAGDQGTPPARARALDGAGALAYDQCEYGRATALHEEALALRRELGDQQGVTRSLHGLGWVAYEQGDLGRAAALHEEALALRRQLGDQEGIVGSLYSLGVVAAVRGDHARAAVLYEECLALGRQLGLRERIAWTLQDLGVVALDQGDRARAAALFDECLALFRELGNRRGLALALVNRGLVALAQGHYDRAAALCTEGLSLAWEQGDKRWVGLGLVGLARAAAVPANPAGDPRRAALLLAGAAALRLAIGAPLHHVEQGPMERAREQALAALGPERFAAAWAEGQALSLDEVVALALDGAGAVLAGE